MSDKKIWSMQLLADYLKVSRMTIYRWSLLVPLRMTSGSVHSAPYMMSLSNDEALDWKDEVQRKTKRRLHYRNIS